jgi:hypothetical protein
MKYDKRIDSIRKSKVVLEKVRRAQGERSESTDGDERSQDCNVLGRASKRARFENTNWNK